MKQAFAWLSLLIAIDHFLLDGELVLKRLRTVM